MRKPTPKQRREELVEQYVFSRRTMMALMALTCSSGLQNFVEVQTEPSKPKAPDNPTIPSLPQKDSGAAQQERQTQLQQTREEYRLDLRLPNSPRVETLPEQEAFSEGYQNNRAALSQKVVVNQEASLENLQPFQSLDDYAALFPVLPLPDIAQNFRDDHVFARQRLSAPNPMELRNVLTLDYDIRDKFEITEDIFKAVLSAKTGRKRINKTLDKVIKEGGLFVTDYGVLDNLQPAENKFFTAPIALYLTERIRGDFQLIPIAIQLGQVPGESLVCTPLDGVDWTLAKLITQTADHYVHQLYRHLGQAHLVMEAIALATARELAARHPVNVLLKPHFEFTMAINNFADEVLINPGGLVDIVFPGTLESSLQLTEKGISDYFQNFSKFALPNNLRERGVDNRSRLRDFPYRDDGLLIWNSLENYVSRYIGIYYKSNQDVSQDSELQNWLQTLRKPVNEGGFGVVSLPEKLTNRDQLIEILTQIVFTGGPQHSAIALIQYQYMAFPPNMPGALYQPAPTTKGKFADENSLTTFLPGVNPSAAQVRLISNVSTKLDPKAFTDFGKNSFQDPRAIRVLQSLQNRLEIVERRIERRNKRRKECYPVFLPSRIPNSVSF